MNSVKRLSDVAILSILSWSLSGQTILEIDPPKNLKDTVYIGIVNKIKLEDTMKLPVSVQSLNTRVRISGNELIIYPTHTGEVIVLISYNDTAIRRNFFSMYLPKPTR